MDHPSLPIAFLGVPLSNLKKEEVVKAIFSYIEDYKIDLQPRYVASVDVDLLVNANYANGSSFQDQELIHILRNTDLSTIDGTPIKWAFRFLEVKVHERVSGSDLFPVLLKESEQRKKSIFLIGGQKKILELCKLYISAEYPNLLLAGSSFPKIDCKGEQVEFSPERDALLVEQINNCKPDILFINLGSPKQELWFDRVKKDLHVPISIGVGEAFDLFTQVILHAPLSMQNSWVEWFFRLFQEPKRLWKRYLKGILRFPSLILLPIIFHNANKLIFNFYYLFSSSLIRSIDSRLFLSPHSSIVLISLPTFFDVDKIIELNSTLEDIFSQDALIFDFEAVKHLSLESIAFLLKLSQRACKYCQPLYFINLKANVRGLFRVHKFEDLIKSHSCGSVDELLKRFHQGGLSATFYDSIHQDHQGVIISFFGNIDQSINYEGYLNKIKPLLTGKSCILDLRYCPYINQITLSVLLKLKKIQEKQGCGLSVKNVNASIKKKLESVSIMCE